MEKNKRFAWRGPGLAILFALVLSMQGRGQTLVDFDASALPASPVPAQLPVFSTAANLGSTAMTRNNLTGAGVSGAFTSTTWPTSVTAPAGGKYLTFTLTPATGYVLNLGGATLSFDCRRNSNGPNNVYVYSSVAGFSSAANSLTTVTPVSSTGSTSVNYTFPTSAAYNNLFSVEIRIYADNANNTNGQLRIMNPSSGKIRLTGGSVTSCVPVISTCTSNGPVCSGTTLSLSSSASSSVSPIVYSWAGPNSFSSALQNPSIGSTTTAASGTYTITATNVCGSSSATTTAFISEVAAATSTSNESCFSSCDGSATAVPSGGVSPYSYAWSSGATSATAASLCHGNYTVTVTDATGCTGSATAAVSYNTCTNFPVTTVPCGLSFNKKTSMVYAASVPGAISYKFFFYDNTTGALVTQYAQPSRMLTLGSVPGLYYNTTYRWTVSVDIGFGYGPESSAGCTITLAPPQTTLPCGANYTTLNSYTVASSPGGISRYRFTLYDVSTGAIVAQRTQASNYFYFNTVTGLSYGTTYNWTVACEYPVSGGGSAFGPESNQNCTVTFAVPQTVLPCGASYSNFNGYTVVPFVSGVTQYRFTFYDNTTGAIVAQRTQTSNYLYFNTLTGLTYGTTYRWTVACEYHTSSGNVFGPESNPNCTVTFAPATTVPCGNTYVLATSYTTAAPVAGASAYRFRFYQNNTLVAEKVQGSNYIYFAQVIGLVNNQTYNWTVEVRFNTPSGLMYGPASNAACTVTFGSAARISGEDSTGVVAASVEDLENDNSGNALLVYPNPATDVLSVNAGEPVLAIYIYSINGELLRTFRNVNEVTIGDLPAGTYFVLAQTENGMKRTPVVKQ